MSGATDVQVTCEAARLLLKARPDTPSLQQSVAEHLNQCTECAEYQSSQSALDQQLANVLVAEPPEWLTSSILERLDPAPVPSWWAHPRVGLALQWSFYLLITGALAFGLFLPMESVATWLQLVLALPSQLGIALEVLMTVIGLIPLEPISSVFEDSTWVYEAAALALVFWVASSEQRARSNSPRPEVSAAGSGP